MIRPLRRALALAAALALSACAVPHLSLPKLPHHDAAPAKAEKAEKAEKPAGRHGVLAFLPGRRTRSPQEKSAPAS